MRSRYVEVEVWKSEGSVHNTATAGAACDVQTVLFGRGYHSVAVATKPSISLEYLRVEHSGGRFVLGLSIQRPIPVSNIN